MTGIELAVDSCVLVNVHRGTDPPRLDAVHVVDPSDWPPRRLARVRRSKRLSPQAVVVDWTGDPSALRPLEQAGFTIGAVVSPEQALAALAAQRGRPQTDGATAWLAVSRWGAAIAIVRGADLLYAKRIRWRYRKATPLNEQLLQRYVLVSHLAPELEHGMAVTRARHGVAVECAMTCGDLPDLRSLTMPLIEELDLEVETLDSLDGLDVTASAARHRAVDHASALQLASAGTALAPESFPRRRWWGRAAAFGLAVIAGGWWMISTPSEPPAARELRPMAVPGPTATAGSSTSEEPVVLLIPRASTGSRVVSADRVGLLAGGTSGWLSLA